MQRWNRAVRGLLVGLVLGLCIVESAVAQSVVYTMTYDPNGAESGTAPASTVGSFARNPVLIQFLVSGNTGNLARAGYIFDGWNTAADYTGEYYVPYNHKGLNTSMAPNNTAYFMASTGLYAQWTAVTSPPTIIAWQTNTPGFLGGGASLYVNALGDGLKLQWYRDGVAIAGATKIAYNTATLTVADNGAVFHVVVSNAYGAVTAETRLAVYPMPSTSAEKVVMATATVQDSPPAIRLQWPSNNEPVGFKVYRRALGAADWEGPVVSVPGLATQAVDTSVVAGVAYEYSVSSVFVQEKVDARPGFTSAGIRAPLAESRGKVVLVVDQSMAAELAGELARLEMDLTGDGWTVVRRDVSRYDSVTNVKAVIKAVYDADPANVKSLFLFGHVPVPYSGDIAPDGHPDHQGAWPADVYYADMDGEWTDTSVNRVNTSWGGRNNNVPGDGKFDPGSIPSALELQMGRVDLANMSMGTEVSLLRQYLNKDHAFRHGEVPVERRGLVSSLSLESYAVQGFWSLGGLFDQASLTKQQSWRPTLTASRYLFAYGFGWGTFTSADQIGNSSEIVNNDAAAVFNGFWGSYFCDWDYSDDFLRAALATPTRGLTSAMQGQRYHAMGMGETIGYSMLCSQNGGYNVYRMRADVCINLMGDPTLRMHPVKPVSNLTAAIVGNGVQLNWTASADSAIVGYHVYRSDSAAGPYTRLTSNPATEPGYIDTSSRTGDVFYMVRAVKLETSHNGTYYNPSQGTFLSMTQDGVAKYPPMIGEPAVSCVITAPTNGTSVYAGSNVTITASAMTGGTNWSYVTNVEFYADGVKIGADATAPYTCTWTASGAGSHTLTVKAMNLQGAFTNVSVTLYAQWTGSPAGSIAASPSRITLRPSELGSTTLSWITTNCEAAQVTVAVDGGTESLFGVASSCTGSVAPWIGFNRVLFRLYADNSHSQLVDSVEVVGTVSPLTVQSDGALRLDNQPFSGTGVNYFDAFGRVLWNAADTTYEDGFRKLGERGIPFARLDLTGYQPIYANLFFTNRAEYLSRLDAMVAAAGRHGVGLVPCFFWTTFAFSDLSGEHLDQLAVSNSVTRQKMREFVTEIVSRYKNSREIWAWEFGNEWNLMVDLPNGDQFLPPTWTNLGNPATRDPVRDVLSSGIILPAMQEVANLVKALDPGRPLSSGHAMSRASQWHMDQWKQGLLPLDQVWTEDTATQAEAIAWRHCPDPFDLLSVHVYGADEQRVSDFAGFATRAGKALFAGEFGAGDTNAFRALLTACQVAPLRAMWVYDNLDHPDDSMNATATNTRSWMLDEIQPSAFLVTYQANGATSGTAPASQTKTQDVALMLAANSGSLAKTGYTFGGWNTAADGTGTSYGDGASYTVNASVTLYAKWVSNAPPVITLQPTNATVTAGATATFSVTASGTPTLVYQWYSNDVAIGGATVSSYTTPATTLADNNAGFKVTVSNAYGVATSTVAVLTVNAAPTGGVVATGGTITNYIQNGTNWTAHIFASSGPLTVTSGGVVEYLVVGGGGGGGVGAANWGGGGGGGAGGMVAGSATVAAQAYDITVGSGGNSQQSGDNSTFNSVTAVGGGQGGDWNTVGTSGGSGGGGGGKAAGGTGTSGQGSNGGVGSGSGAYDGAAGGGGKGAAGGSASGGTAGNGGDGTISTITGASVAYAGGGGGGGQSAGGTGGSGIGGNGGSSGSQNGADGAINTGSGGGGAGGNSGLGGKGGSGIVIVRYVTGGADPRADSDGDGMSDADEAIAGTDPHSATSCLVLYASTNSPVADGKIVVSWQSVTGRTYTVMATTSPMSAFTNLFPTNIAATPNVNVYTDNVGNAVQRFYRVRVE